MIRRLQNIVLASFALASSVFANSVLLAGDEAVTGLRWRPGPVRIAISASLSRESSNIKRDSDVAGAIARSLETWSRAADVDLIQVASDKLSASPSGVAGDGVSLITIAQTPENVLLFAKDPENAAATTRVFYNRGIITEADIVLNPYQQFSTDGTLGTFDLESTITHEIGHLLGLAHSLVLGSTMHSNYGKNGVFGLQNFSSRTLSADDNAAVRAIYGVREETVECCGSIEGRVTVPGKQAREIQVWIEDSAGRVHGSTKSAPDGEVRFAGVNAGRYRLFAQEIGRFRNTVVAVREIGDVVVASGATTTIAAKASTDFRDFDLSYIGFNGQLSEMAVSLSAGRPYVVYLGGKNLDPKRLSVSFTSPHLSVVPDSMRTLDYGDEVSVISFEVRVGARIPKGEYSVFVESDRGDKRALIGAVTVDNFVNPWSSFSTFDE